MCGEIVKNNVKDLLFCSDLDNTLIYSHRHEIGADKVCVEHYQGREVSFMTEKSLELLRRAVQKMLFVPVTTRTQEQYRRIDLHIGTPEYALVCNGGVLLVNGKEDETWYVQSLERIADCENELLTGARCMEEDPDRTFEVRNIRSLFLFTKSKRPDRSAVRLREALDLTRMEVFCNGAKVYAVPVALNKGIAVQRLRKRLHAGFVAAAGDSEFDVSLLAAADLAMAPADFAGRLREELAGKELWTPPKGSEDVFSDVFLEYLLSGNSAF